MAVGGEMAAAPVAGRGQGRDLRRRLGGCQPADVQPLRTLHGDPLAAEALVVLGHREDQVAELAKPAVGPDLGGLATIEVDRPAAERDGRRRSALRPDDARGAAAGTLPGEPTVQDHDPADARGLREPARPAADRAGADDDEIGALEVSHAPRIGRLAGAPDGPFLLVHLLSGGRPVLAGAPAQRRTRCPFNGRTDRRRLHP